VLVPSHPEHDDGSPDDRKNVRLLVTLAIMASVVVVVLLHVFGVLGSSIHR